MMKYDNNLAVIGAGSAGLTASFIAATLKAEVTLIEKDKMGGDCLNTGCVPSKALIRTAKLIRDLKNSSALGVDVPDFRVNFSGIMERVQNVVKQIEPHDSVERYQNLGVNVIRGEAELVSEHEVRVNGKIITARNIVLATGASPVVPPIPGIEQTNYLTSDNLWELDKLPAKLAVVGGGPIGSEMAQAFSMLGSKVTIINRGKRILPREDEDIAEIIINRFAQEGVEVLSGCDIQKIDNETLYFSRAGAEENYKFDKILFAAGRIANVRDFGLKKLGIKLNPNRTIAVDPFMRTNIKNIFVAGDVAGPYQFTHTASYQAYFATINALFGKLKKFKVGYQVIPRVTFVSPEVAGVGLNEKEAESRGIKYELSCYKIAELDRAITENSTEGLVKVLTVPGKDKILGVTIAAKHGGEMASEFAVAMRHKLGLNKIMATVHAYPTWTEANKFAAGVWKKNHASWLGLKLLQLLHVITR